MKTKWFWNLLMMLIVALSMASCGSDDDEKKDDDGEGGTTVTTEYTATTEVKEVKLRALQYIEPYCAIYADFNRKYTLDLSGGRLYLSIYLRQNGKWEYYRGYDSNYYAGIKDLGKQSNIMAVTEKIIDGIYAYSEVAQPQHGYAMRFKTENEEWKYLRVYIRGYTLDDKEALSSITVQYQLY